MSNFVMQYKEAEVGENMAEASRQTAWAALVQEALIHYASVSGPSIGDDVEYAMNELRSTEDQYMTEMYAAIPEAKKADGTWKYRKFKYTDGDGNEQTGGLPPAYASAKSTVRQALLNEVFLQDSDMNVRPKSEIAGELAAVKAAQKEGKSDFEKAMIVVQTLEKLVIKLSTAEAEDVHNAVMGIFKD